MKQERAAELADQILLTLLQHQPEFFGRGFNVQSAPMAAKTIATFRNTLVAELEQQVSRTGER